MSYKATCSIVYSNSYSTDSAENDDNSMASWKRGRIKAFYSFPLLIPLFQLQMWLLICPDIFENVFYFLETKYDCQIYMRVYLTSYWNGKGWRIIKAFYSLPSLIPPFQLEIWVLLNSKYTYLALDIYVNKTLCVFSISLNFQPAITIVIKSTTLSSSFFLHIKHSNGCSKPLCG